MTRIATRVGIKRISPAAHTYPAKQKMLVAKSSTEHVPRFYDLPPAINSVPFLPLSFSLSLSPTHPLQADKRHFLYKTAAAMACVTRTDADGGTKGRNTRAKNASVRPPKLCLLQCALRMSRAIIRKHTKPLEGFVFFLYYGDPGFQVYLADKKH